MEPIILELPESIDLTDDQLYDLCILNRELVIERNNQYQLSIMTPAGSLSSHRNSNLTADFIIWNRESKLGIVFDSSGGFRLPKGQMFAPDVSFVTTERWDKLNIDDQEKFAPLCPDFIAELQSRTDSLKRLKAKMQIWMDNGCRLAWLIDPYDQKAYIYRADGSIQTVKSFTGVKLSGEDVLPGFELNLEILLRK
jgi:Uma2 family endonuclease